MRLLVEIEEVVGADGRPLMEPWHCGSCGRVWWRMLSEEKIDTNPLSKCCKQEWARDDSLGHEKNALGVWRAAMTSRAFQAGKESTR